MEENITVTNPKPNPLTSVTPLSKLLALILFISLPFLGFYLGMRYQKASSIPAPSTVVNSNPVNQPLSPSANVIQPQASPSSSTNSEMANWKTYISAKYNYSVQYPSDWTYRDIQYRSKGSLDTAPSFIGIGFRPNEPAPIDEEYTFINIEIFDNPNKLSLESLVENWYDFGTEPGVLSNAVKNGEDIIVSGIRGKKVVNPPIDTVGLPVTWLLINRKDKVFVFSIILDKSYPEINKNQVFNQILSTFKFTN